jgi:hypothetical protein
MAEQKLDSLTEQLENDALRIEKAESIEKKIKAQEEDGQDGFSGEKLKLIPSPNFTGCNSVGTLLPINMADETVTNLSQLSQQFDFITFIKEKLGYASGIRVCQSFASEQIDALVLAIKSFEKDNAFILGDMAGIGKGRVCAGVLRYAYQNGFIPVFLTHKPYLLNDIYRDIKDIDGLGYNKNEKVMPKPFILHHDGMIQDRDGSIIATPPKGKVANQICKGVTEKAEKEGIIELPKEYNCVFLPYSTISMSKSTIKQNFLEAIAPKSIFVFDESHNAASAKTDSNISKRAIPIVKASKAVLFSSATYAKTPNVFGLYVVKTALASAVPSLDNITDALKIGGENVSEYIASGLVKEGQMIRRQRSFGDCKKVTDYVGTTRTLNVLGETIYNQLQGDNQREFYDEAIGYFKELRDFSKSDLAKNAVLRSVFRECQLQGKELIDFSLYKSAKASASDSTARDIFKREYRGKWIITSDMSDSIARYKQTFRENLFFALKAKYAADKIIETLLTPVNYTNVDGSMYNAPMKPIIAVRNTGESIFTELKLEEGVEINNDFSEYLRALYLKMFSGTFVIRKVDNNIFETKSSLLDRGADFEEEQLDYEVELSDFSDEGVRITEIQSRLNNYTSNIPFSVIDYLKNRIESIERPDFYYTDGNKIYPKYGQAASTNFIMGEGTSRNHMLKYNPESGKWIYTKNNREKSTTKLFRAFNNGAIDVMMINQVASTGGSAQSSPSEGVDTRPRNMFIIQFELDINVEVQKRGRVNRTGQLNNPTYTYIITKIPVEKRTYLMFRKKLRKLDANTSADQTSSASDANIKDDKGNIVEDILNAYGFEVFSKDFIEISQGDYDFQYKEIYDNLTFRFTNTSTAGEAEQDEYNIEKFNSFVLELELYPAKFQEYFFDVMNEKYKQKVEQLISLNEYQVELEAKNYKAALKQRVVIALNSGDTVFSLPLFLTDYYTIDDKRVYSKDKVEQKMNELATLPDGRSLPPREFHANLIDDYIAEWDRSQALLMENYRTTSEPKREDFDDGETYAVAMDRYVAREGALWIREREDRNKMLTFMNFFKPGRAVQFEGNNGMFVGYKIKDTGTRFKYSLGSVEFIFCFLSKYRILHFKVSSDSDKLNLIMNVTNLFQGDKMSKIVQEWKPDYYKRTIKRFLSGNILSGIIEANKKKMASEITSYALTRFTNIDGTYNTAVELKFEKDLPATTIINTSSQDLSVTSDNNQFVDFVKKIPITFSYSGSEIIPIWNIENDKTIDRSVAILRRRSGRSEQDESVSNIVTIEILQQYVKDSKTGENKEILIPPSGVVPKRYNPIYHDNLLLDRYIEYRIENGRKISIKYGAKKWNEKKPGGGIKPRSEYNVMTVNVKSYNFDVATSSGFQAFKDLCIELHTKYDMAFNFRSNNSDYYNISNQGDVEPEELVRTTTNKKTFEEGVYQYRFITKVTDAFIDNIPNVINRTYEGAYGGVELNYPLSPISLPSYELKPYRLPNEVMIKLVFSVLSDDKKLEFSKQLEDKALTENAYTIGEYVSSYLSDKSVNILYFFGDLRTSEYGLIFKEYALKNDVKQIFFEENVKKETKDAKTKVTFEDAEKFLFALL